MLKKINAPLFIFFNVLLLLFAFFSGAVYDYLRAMVASNYKTIYLEIFALLSVAVTIFAVLSDKIKVNKIVKRCVCVTVAVICIPLYFIVTRRLITVQILDVTCNFLHSRYFIPILFGFEITNFALTFFKKKDPA